MDDDDDRRDRAATVALFVVIGLAAIAGAFVAVSVYDWFR